MNNPISLTRRRLLADGGALAVSFALSPGIVPAQNAPKLPGDLEKSPMLDSWISIDAQGQVTVFAGKAELGQGIKTAFIQCAAEELAVDPAGITLITADTERTPNEGYTAGSHSMQDCGTAILNAAAQVRAVLIELAGARLNLPPEQLQAKDGVITAQDGRSVRYKDLVAGQDLHRAAQATSPLKDPKSYTVIGKPMHRVDIPAKVTGRPAYVQDLRFDGMLHARVVQPPNYEAKLAGIETAPIEKMPGVVKVVRDGRFLAVVAGREYQVVEAMQALSAAARWEETAIFPDPRSISDYVRALPSNDTTILEKGTRTQGVQSLRATYHRPYQLHGAIGPSCAVAKFEAGKLTVWTHSQGVYPLRNALADMMRLPQQQVHCIHVEGSGCYGHNGADDVAADAALIARAIPGRAVRVQWMREQEHGYEPFGPVMISEIAASLDAEGKLTDWQYDVWSNTHSTRPEGPAGNLLSARFLSQPFEQPAPKPIPQPEGGGDRNAIPIYAVPNARVVSHFIPQMPLRVSALRALGAYHNVFSIESFMDELAAAAKIDPVEFRLRHLDDPRAREVIMMVAKQFGWQANTKPGHGGGRGFAFARYKNLAAYCAVAVDLKVERETGRVKLGRIVAAVDSGHAVNHDGIRNQIEGAIVQSASWTLYEAVTFDRNRITSRDWSSFPIMRFPAVPESIDVHVIDRPGEKFLGTGEAGQGPAAAAIANAIAHATGARIRDLPLTARRIKAAIGV
jgi:nicotinate dehydrogenase subunit B